MIRYMTTNDDVIVISRPAWRDTDSVTAAVFEVVTGSTNTVREQPSRLALTAA